MCFLFFLMLLGTSQSEVGQCRLRQCIKPCKISETTAVGRLAPTGDICSGELIFEDTFQYFDKTKWRRENTLSGGGNGEFQWYTTSENNSFTKDGSLHIMPTFLSERYGNDFLYNGTIDLGDRCTESFSNGCEETATKTKILKPIQSGKLTTKDSFAFKYGKLEVRAKLPSGDWLWPAIWMFPKDSAYGGWPASGEIDVVEGRGNKHMNTDQGVNIGNQLMSSSLHWGPNPNYNRYYLTHYEKSDRNGFDGGYHTYTMNWTPKSISFLVDGIQTGSVSPPAGGFWELGHLSDSGVPDPWNSQMGPFDKEFFIIINLAIGGTNYYFPDNVDYGKAGKPWDNRSPSAVTEFWEKREDWEPTWQREDSTSHLKVDYVRVWAL